MARLVLEWNDMHRHLIVASVVVLFVGCKGSQGSSPDSSTAINCANAGCAAPPACGQPCTAPCGCCFNAACIADAASPSADVPASDRTTDAQPPDRSPETTINCANVGCGPPPSCGQACTAPCGCCAGPICPVDATSEQFDR